MSDRLRAAFRGQGKSCAMLGSPFMGRLMPLIGERLGPGDPVSDRLLAWPGEVGPGGQSVPLRLAGALHGLLLDGADTDLWAAYPPNAAPDAALWAAVEGAFRRHAARLMGWLDHAPQTNEVRRAGVLIPALWWALAQYRLPLHLLELGASGGLNLGLDGFRLETGGQACGPADSPVRLTPEWRGPRPAPLAQPIVVRERAGVDLNPLDPRDPDQALRLLAYLWPDQPERLALTRGAMALAAHRPPPARGDAGDWIAAQLATRRPGRLTVVYHTIAWQYFPPATQTRAHAAISAAGAAATPEAPLVHIAMEADRDKGSAALTGRLWPDPTGGNRPRLLARVDFHGRWIDWRE
jgi:hypothetical protein